MTKSDPEENNIKMYAAQSFVLRVSIVLGMVAAVVTILYFTPMPAFTDEYILSCDRPCHHLDWPMICRIKLTLGTYQANRMCGNCTNSDPLCDDQQCIIDSEKSYQYDILTANHQSPGPNIHVCQNDILVIDVINTIPGHSATIHWRGQPQDETPIMDGVPMITQCPIPSYTTFQYKFRASSPGTHLWHAHAGKDASDGLIGALVVRQPNNLEPHKSLYDIDDKSHILVITQAHEKSYYDQSEVLVINGISAPNVFTFKVIKGKRYRFRVAYAEGSCPVTLSLKDHFVKVIAVDGKPIIPYEVNLLTMAKGERIDFILKANKEKGAYELNVTSECEGRVLKGNAIVDYEELPNFKKPHKLLSDRQKSDVTETSSRKFSTGVCESEIGRVCIGDVHALRKIPYKLKGYDVDKRFYLPFDFVITDIRGPTNFKAKMYRLNNITFTYPSSPLLTQYGDVSSRILCNGLDKPEACFDKPICECVHVEQVPVDSTVEIILIDQGGDAEEQIFHLHGYSFFVVGSRKFKASINVEEVRRLDSDGTLFKRNFNNPVMKDTIRIPKYGVVAIRFIANNPGFWMLRDENAKHWTRGLDVVFQVGDTNDMVPPPSNFPKCGSWIGPDFFLL